MERLAHVPAGSRRPLHTLPAAPSVLIRNRCREIEQAAIEQCDELPLGDHLLLPIQQRAQREQRCELPRRDRPRLAFRSRMASVVLRDHAVRGVLAEGGQIVRQQCC